MTRLRPCSVCFEPWEMPLAMTRWEHKLFVGGFGCPVCRGVDDRHPLQQLADLRGLPPADRPAWVKPDPEVVWTCSCCEAQVGIDPDDDLLLWMNGRPLHGEAGTSRSYGALYRAGLPRHEPIMLAGAAYCPGCTTTCCECGTLVFAGPASDFADSPEDEGYSMPHPDNLTGSVCSVCFLELSGEDDDNYTEEEDENDASF